HCGDDGNAGVSLQVVLPRARDPELRAQRARFRRRRPDPRDAARDGRGARQGDPGALACAHHRIGPARGIMAAAPKVAAATPHSHWNRRPYPLPMPRRWIDFLYGHPALTFVLMVAFFIFFGVTSVNLFVLLKMNIDLFIQYGLIVIADGALEQLFDLLTS